MAEYGFRPVNGTSTLNNDFSLIHTADASSLNQHLDVENAHFEFSEMETGEHSPQDLDSLIDEIQDEQEDSDSDFEEIVIPSRKRKRVTNNSLAVGLDEEDGDFTDSSPSKRLQPDTKDKGIFIGVWKNSPEPDPSKKHAVYGYLARDGSLRRKIYPETPDGTNIPEDCPMGPSRCVSHGDVLLELHLSYLTSAQIKEFIRIRSAARFLNETLEEKRQAESLAAQEAIRNVAEQFNQSNTTPLRPKTEKVKPQVRNATIKEVRGVLLGFWKGSDAPRDDDKHAVYGLISGPKLRIKVLRHTRDGRSYQGNWPGGGAEWISYDDAVLEPGLAKLTRTEIKEYVRLREVERKNGDSSAGIDLMVLEKARSNAAADARAKGTTVAQLDAAIEYSRKTRNEKRKQARESEAVTGFPRKEDASNGKCQDNSVSGCTTAMHEQDELVGLSAKTSALPIQPKAIRSSKAESNARAERMKRAKDVIDKVQVDLGLTEGATNGPFSIETQRINPAAQQVEQVHLQEGKGASRARQKEREGREARRQASIEERRLFKEQKEKMEAELQDAARKREAEAAKAATKKQDLTEQQGGVEKAELARAREVDEIHTERLKAPSLRETARHLGKEALYSNAARTSEDVARQEEEQSEAARQGGISMLPERAAAAREAAKRKEENPAASKEQAEEWEANATQAAELGDATRLQAIQCEKANSQTLTVSEHDVAEAMRDELLTKDHVQVNLLPIKNGSLEGLRTDAMFPAPATVGGILLASPDFKWHKGVEYERKRTGPFAGKLVSKNPQLVKRDEEDCLEYRVLVPCPCSNATSVNGKIYGRKKNPPDYPFSPDMMVSKFPEGLTIDGEDYLEYWVLKVIEF